MARILHFHNWKTVAGPEISIQAAETVFNPRKSRSWQAGHVFPCQIIREISMICSGCQRAVRFLHWASSAILLRFCLRHGDGVQRMLHGIQHRGLDLHVLLPFLLWWQMSQIGHRVHLILILALHAIGIASTKAWAIAEATWRQKHQLMGNSGCTWEPVQKQTETIQ